MLRSHDKCLDFRASGNHKQSHPFLNPPKSCRREEHAILEDVDIVALKKQRNELSDSIKRVEITIEKQNQRASNLAMQSHSLFKTTHRNQENLKDSTTRAERCASKDIMSLHVVEGVHGTTSSGGLRIKGEHSLISQENTYNSYYDIMKVDNIDAIQSEIDDNLKRLVDGTIHISECEIQLKELTNDCIELLNKHDGNKSSFLGKTASEKEYFLQALYGSNSAETEAMWIELQAKCRKYEVAVQKCGNHRTNALRDWVYSTYGDVQRLLRDVERTERNLIEITHEAADVQSEISNLSSELPQMQPEEVAIL